MLPRVDGPAVPAPADAEELCSLVAQEAAACAAAIDAVEKGPGTADAVRARARAERSKNRYATVPKGVRDDQAVIADKGIVSNAKFK